MHEARWTERILSHFTGRSHPAVGGVRPLTINCWTKSCCPSCAAGLRADAVRRPVRLRAEYEERYRAAWDRGEPGPAPRWFASAQRRCECVAVGHRASRSWFASALLICSRLAYSAVQQVEPEHFAGLFHAHQTELQNARGENESKDFILEHVYQLAPRSIRNPVDFWRELLRMHFANRSLPPCSPSTRQASSRQRAVHGSARRHMAGIQERAARGTGCVVSLPDEIGAGWHARGEPPPPETASPRSRFRSTTPMCRCWSIPCSSTAACIRWRFTAFRRGCRVDQGRHCPGPGGVAGFGAQRHRWPDRDDANGGLFAQGLERVRQTLR